MKDAASIQVLAFACEDVVISGRTEPPPSPGALLPLTHIVYYVLLSLTSEPRHGYAIIKDVFARTEGGLEIEAGTLYAAIKRMRSDALIEEASAPEGTDARRRYYRVTPFGRRVLQAESRRLEEMVRLARQADVLPSAPRARA